MQFRTHPTGELSKDRSIVLHGPEAPGTFVTKVPRVADVQLRQGCIVALDSTGTHVLWNPWQPVSGIGKGDLFVLMGCSGRETAKQRRRRLYLEQKKATP